MSVADQSKLEAAANFLLNERGYLVIGVNFDAHEVGDIIRKLWNVPVDQPMRVIAKTNEADWREQCQIASNHFPSDFKRDFYKEATGGD